MESIVRYGQDDSGVSEELAPFLLEWGKTWGKPWGWGNPLHHFLGVWAMK